MTFSAFDLLVRECVYDHFVHRGFPPTAQQVAKGIRMPVEDVKTAYRNLAEGHALVLRPHDDSRIWVAHPFSAVPTPFVVKTEHGTWWGNCIWDSLGIAAALNQDAIIETRSGAIGESLIVRIEAGKILDPSPVIHFSVPAAHWWDDIALTCGTILLFKSPDVIDPWCEQHDIPKGATITLAQGWELAQNWYGDRLHKKWRRKTKEEAHEIFKTLGFTGSFWKLD